MSQAKPHAQRPPSPTSQSIGGFWWRVFHMVEQNTPRKDAGKTRHWEWRVLGERAGWTAVWIVLRPIQHEGGQWCAAPFLFRQDLRNSYWWPGCALACLYSEARLFKGAREATRPHSTTLHSTGNSSVWTKKVGHSNKRGTVRLCSFPLKFTAAH
jgi:hypothetical protein